MIEINYTPADNLNSALDNLYTIITLLRSPDGCPWDRIQTNKTTTESLIDESYEYLDGVMKNSIPSEREEIGDVMINVFMNLRIHEENGDFKPYEAVNEVCEKLIRRHPHVFSDARAENAGEVVCEKLIRRHPHVFSDARAENAGEVLSLWNSVKENVEGHKDTQEDFFSHIPSSLPPLESSYEIQKKLKKVGFDWKNVEGVIEKVKEELSEVEEAVKEDDKDHIEEEIGDLLFSVVNLSRFLKVRPNTALFRCNGKIKARFQKLFDRAHEKGIPLDKEHVDEMNALWDEIKEEEK